MSSPSSSSLHAPAVPESSSAGSDPFAACPLLRSLRNDADIQFELLRFLRLNEIGILARSHRLWSVWLDADRALSKRYRDLRPSRFPLLLACSWALRAIDQLSFQSEYSEDDVDGKEPSQQTLQATEDLGLALVAAAQHKAHILVELEFTVSHVPLPDGLLERCISPLVKLQALLVTLPGDGGADSTAHQVLSSKFKVQSSDFIVDFNGQRITTCPAHSLDPTTKEEEEKHRGGSSRRTRAQQRQQQRWHLDSRSIVFRCCCFLLPLLFSFPSSLQRFTWLGTARLGSALCSALGLSALGSGSGSGLSTQAVGLRHAGTSTCVTAAGSACAQRSLLSSPPLRRAPSSASNTSSLSAHPPLTELRLFGRFDHPELVDLSVLPSLPALEMFEIFSRNYSYEATAAQLDCISRCLALNVLGLGNWCPEDTEPRAGDEDKSIEERLEAGIGCLVKRQLQSNTSAGTASALSVLQWFGTRMTSALWRHVSQLTTLENLYLGLWSADMTPDQWAQLPSFTRLLEISIYPDEMEDDGVTSVLKIEEFLPALVQCKTLEYIQLGAALMLTAAHLETIASGLPKLNGLTLFATRVESLLPLQHAPSLTDLSINRCIGLAAEPVQFRVGFPALLLLQKLEIEDRADFTDTPEELAALNAQLRAACPSLAEFVELVAEVDEDSDDEEDGDDEDQEDDEDDEQVVQVDEEEAAPPDLPADN